VSGISRGFFRPALTLTPTATAVWTLRLTSSFLRASSGWSRTFEGGATMSKQNTYCGHALSKLTKITGELHAIFKRGTADVLEVGRLLSLAKQEVGHGEFLPWLEKEFSLSVKSAERYMAANKVAASLFKSDNLTILKLRPSAIYALAEMHSRGAVTEALRQVVLKEAAEKWIGGKRLIEILKTFDVGVSAKTTIAGAKSAQLSAGGKVMTSETANLAQSAEATGNRTGETVDGNIGARRRPP
jgi:hypothetical protein